MKKKAALNMAIGALKHQKKEFAFDAHLFERGVETSHTRKSYEMYMNISLALEIIEEMKKLI